MKTYTAVLLFAVIMWYNMEVDALDFSIGGHFNPGIIFGITPSPQQKHRLRNSKNAGSAHWPQAESVNNHDVSAQIERSPTRNHGSRRRNNRHENL